MQEKLADVLTTERRGIGNPVSEHAVAQQALKHAESRIEKSVALARAALKRL